ncbi:probable Dihydroxyacetone kinase 1 [Saccharomycodes ludwigii]|uniref:Probable Dihydroxyacetone kinase 1 n=1 Tax=Saccharomycodes ludwigii TaxID=36035 RepID=A0A376B2E9_9ASCO|nr:hypothetical protein SCDLUD_004340 [Saccharomycodes ludwigii]KAH3900023.1 hypothetical protein SCDLUD_004340 [Saccharomycodes ludwigii]SSD58802.1 probable Dihydroxyacetone kinase 1 [Saccharomycodes ludwigii]
MKSFEVSDSVLTSLQGFVQCNPSLTLVESEKIIYRKQNTTNGKKTVGLISGGGAGHEPTHAGFVGKGMLTAAVSGDIFASPSTRQILNAIKLVNNDPSTNGVLLIIKSYTGDILHFSLAAERAKAIGINCEIACVGDDVAVGREKGKFVPRRALAGTVLVHKCVGAFAELYSDKYGVAGCQKVANILNDNLVTIGASLDHCQVPGRKYESELTENQMELGMGIHNEPGVQVLEPIPSAEKLVGEYMLPKLLDPKDKNRYFVDFEKNDDVILLVNNLGGVSNFVITSIVKITTDLLLKNYNIKPKHTISGTLMTAFNGNGFSITLINASKTSKSLSESFQSLDINLFDLLNHPTDATSWPQQHDLSKIAPPTYNPSILKEEITAQPAGKFDFALFSKMIQGGAESIIKAEPHITELDTHVGDGDCGYTLAAGAKGINENLTSIPHKSLSITLAYISDLVEKYMGGTSGGLYSLLITGISKGVITYCGENEQVTPETLAKSLEYGLETLYRSTNARPGDYTMVDALEPFIKTFEKTKNFSEAVLAAKKGAEQTAKIDAKFGRASYVGSTTNIPDPGAVGFYEFVAGMEKAAK